VKKYHVNYNLIKTFYKFIKEMSIFKFINTQKSYKEINGIKVQHIINKIQQLFIVEFLKKKTYIIISQSVCTKVRTVIKKNIPQISQKKTHHI